jgi:hypothetical protein
MRRIFSAIMTILIAASAFAQDKEVVTRGPQQDGSSLDATLKSINAELAQPRTLTYSETNSAGTTRYTNVLQELEEATTPCNISYKKTERLIFLGGNRKMEKLFTQDHEDQSELSLRGMTRVETVRSSEYYRQLGSDFRDDPELFYVSVQLRRGTTGTLRYRVISPFAHKTKPIDGSSSTGGVQLLFLDEDRGQRVARSLQHAMELCGGGKPDEPFWPFPL